LVHLSGVVFPHRLEDWRRQLSTQNGGPAFPVDPGFSGMNLRDYFAAKAMQSIVSCVVPGLSASSQESINAIGTAAYVIADAMLKERTK
jgi:hypothetical protein